MADSRPARSAISLGERFRVAHALELLKLVRVRGARGTTVQDQRAEGQDGLGKTAGPTGAKA